VDEVGASSWRSDDGSEHAGGCLKGTDNGRDLVC
jgi:hypothetical protein